MVAKKTTAVHRTVKCPGDGCLGFIPQSGPGSGFCGLCSMRVCKDCNKALESQDMVHAHAATGCNADDKAAWALIVKTSVMCPKCGTPIQKVDGCNQMWCTVPGCNTAFDWSTGRVVNGPVHNPHYHEWLRQGNRMPEQANVDCQGLPRDRFNHHRLEWIYAVLDPGYIHGSLEAQHAYRITCQWLQAIPESLDVMVRNEPYTPQIYEDLRIAYLQQRITKEKWASKLSHRETLRIKSSRLAALHSMFQNACVDLFTNLFDELVQARAAAGHGAGPIQGPIMPPVGLPELIAFNSAMESLRMYYAQQVMVVLSDYSDTRIRMLVWNNESGPGLEKRPPGLEDEIWTIQNIQGRYLTLLRWEIVTLHA